MLWSNNKFEMIKTISIVLNLSLSGGFLTQPYVAAHNIKHVDKNQSCLLLVWIRTRERTHWPQSNLQKAIEKTHFNVYITWKKQGFFFYL